MANTHASNVYIFKKSHNKNRIKKVRKFFLHIKFTVKNHLENVGLAIQKNIFVWCKDHE